MHARKRSGKPATTTRSRAATRAATTTAALVAATLAGHAQGAHLERSPAGKLADGTPIEAFTLSNASGLSARVLTYGATLQSVTKVRGAVKLVAPGSLPNDGKVIADERPVD